MFVSKEVDYGLRTLVVIASHPPLALTATAISSHFNIPQNFIALLLPKLIRAGLVAQEKVKKKEHLKLTREAGKVSLLEIVEAINGPLELVVYGKSGVEDLHPMLTMWDGLKKTIEDYLTKETLEQFVFKVPQID